MNKRRLHSFEVSEASEVLRLKLWTGFERPIVAGVSDGTVFDYSLNGNTGTIDKDDAVTVPVYPGFSFDGADSLITVAFDSTIDANNKAQFSISAWINPASDGENNTGRIVDKRDSIAASTVGYLLLVQSEASSAVKLNFFVHHANTDSQTITTNPVLPINTWSHVAAVYNEDGVGKGKLYVKGVLETLGTDIAGDVIGVPADDSAVDLTIGNATADTARTFDGKIDDVRIYNISRTAAQMRDLYEQTRWRYGV